MRRMTAGGLALFAMTWAGSAFALGLGEMDVRSHLNQGFSAVVPVVGASETDFENLSVQLAGADAFARAGLERVDYLSTLKFSVEQAPDGTAQLRIRSNDLAREPFLSFVVEVRWSGGKLVREYTALLDPPGAETAPVPAPAVAAAAKPAAPVSEPPPAAARPASPAGESSPARPGRAEPRPAKRAPVSDAESAAGTYGPVEANETLWSIATRLQPGLGGTLDQILLALYQKNHSAFEGGSIDRLMKGMTLATPSASELRAIDPAAAQHKVAELRGLAPAAVEPRPEKPVVAKPAETAKPEVAKPEPAKPVAQAPAPIQPPNLKGILPGEGGKPVPAPAPAPAPAPTPAPAPAQTPTPAPAAAVPPPVVPPPAVSPPAEVAPAAIPEPPVPAPAPVIALPKPAPAPAPAAGGGFELPLPALAGLGALLFGVLALLMVRRRRAAAENAAGPASFGEMPSIGGPVDEQRDVLLEPARPSELDAETLLKPLPQQIPRPAPPAAEPEPEPALPEPTTPDQLEFERAGADAPPPLSVAPEAADPLADADFHLSYGLHEEAANILKAALAKEPMRLDLKLKLADVYFAGRRGLDFQELAEQLRPLVDTAEWKHIVENGRQLVPNAPIFRPTMAAPGLGTLGDMDLDQFDLGGEPLPPPAEPAATGKPAEAPPLDLSSFDLAKGDDGKPERIEFNLDELDLAKHEEGEPSFTLGDEFDTKLDLARAYADMGDAEAALNLLKEVVGGGNEKQKLEAKTLHDRLKA